MGILAPIARALVREHLHSPITGELLLIGRQTMPFTVLQAAQMIEEEGVPLRPGVDLNNIALLDKSTRYGQDQGFISDVGFFSLFCDARVRALDVTDYEGAEIVHDMCTPIQDELVGTIDFLWNGSCLDNMFDPATALRNTVKLLKPGGRATLMEIGTPHHNAYTIYSPAYFFDFFAINEFADCKVYVCAFPYLAINECPFDLFTWAAYEGTLQQFPIYRMPPDTGIISYVVAEKGPNATWDKSPVQGQYRPDHATYQEAFQRFEGSVRPKLRNPTSRHSSIRYEELIDCASSHVVEYLGTLRNTKPLE